MIRPPRLSLSHSTRVLLIIKHLISFWQAHRGQRQLHPKSTQTDGLIYCATRADIYIVRVWLLEPNFYLTREHRRVDGCFYLSVFTSKLTRLSSYKRQWRALRGENERQSQRESERQPQWLVLKALFSNGTHSQPARHWASKSKEQSQKQWMGVSMPVCQPFEDGIMPLSNIASFCGIGREES